MATCPTSHAPGRNESEAWVPSPHPAPASEWGFSLLLLYPVVLTSCWRLSLQLSPEGARAGALFPLVSAFALAIFFLVKLATGDPRRQSGEGPVVPKTGEACGALEGGLIRSAAQVSLSARRPLVCCLGTVKGMPPSPPG